jgi:hypothetical protein
MSKQELLELMKQEQDNTNEHRSWHAFQRVIEYLEQEAGK